MTPVQHAGMRAQRGASGWSSHVLELLTLQVEPMESHT